MQPRCVSKALLFFSPFPPLFLRDQVGDRFSPIPFQGCSSLPRLFVASFGSFSSLQARINRGAAREDGSAQFDGLRFCLYARGHKNPKVTQGCPTRWHHLGFDTPLLLPWDQREVISPLNSFDVVLLLVEGEKCWENASLCSRNQQEKTYNKTRNPTKTKSNRI